MLRQSFLPFFHPARTIREFRLSRTSCGHSRCPERLVVFAGKKDVLGAADQDVFAGGDGTEQFMNQALIANPALLLGLPYSSFTAGVVMPRQWGGMSAFVYDPQDRTNDFFRLEDLFSQGIIIGAEIKKKTNFFCLPGEHHVGGIWKHVDQVDLEFNAPPPGEYPYPSIPGVSHQTRRLHDLLRIRPVLEVVFE